MNFMVKEVDVKLEAFPGLMKKEYHYESPKMHFMQNPKMIQTPTPTILSPPAQQDILQATPKPKKKAPVVSEKVEAKPKESKKARKLL
jgi:hypothetical protein